MRILKGIVGRTLKVNFQSLVRIPVGTIGELEQTNQIIEDKKNMRWTVYFEKIYLIMY